MGKGVGGSRPGSAGRRPPWVSPGVASVGAASFFSDAGHEIATAVLPAFLTGVLGGSAATLGLIEGLSDALLGLAKLVSGPLANQPTRRVQLARGGYLLTAVFTAALGLVTTVWQAGVLRAAAWVARGARTPARDAMLAGLAPPDAYGRAFGVERAGDNMGAVVGPLLASLLVATVGLRSSFLFALIPGTLAAVAISVAAARARRMTTAVPVRGRARLELRSLHRARLFRPLLPVALFELGNITTTLLILRATQLLEHAGRSPTAAASVAIVLYAGHNLTAAIVALAGAPGLTGRGRGWCSPPGPAPMSWPTAACVPDPPLAAAGGMLLCCWGRHRAGRAGRVHPGRPAAARPAAWQRLRAAGWAPVGRRLPVVGNRGSAVCSGCPSGRVGLCRGLDGPRGRRHRLAPPSRGPGRELRPVRAASDQHRLSVGEPRGRMALV
jgi:MFS family permease